VGKLAAFDCVIGSVTRGLPAVRTPGNDFGSVAAAISPPTETLIFDLLLHREVVLNDLETLVYGFPHGGLASPAVQTVPNLLPTQAEAVELAGSPPAISTPLVPRYKQIVGRAYERMSWNPSDFRGLRVEMPHPPMSSRIVLRWRLPEARFGRFRD